MRKAGGQAGLAAAADAQPNDVLVLVHVAQGVVEGHDPLFVELGLALEGIGFEDQDFGQAGVLEPELAGVLAFALIFLLQHVGEPAGVGEVLVGGQLEVVVPVGQEVAQAQIFEHVGEFFSHGRSFRRRWEARPAAPGSWITGADRSGSLPDRLARWRKAASISTRGTWPGPCVGDRARRCSGGFAGW